MGIHEGDVTVDVSVQADWTGALATTFDVRLGRPGGDLEKVNEFFETRLQMEVGVGAPCVRIGGLG